MVTVKLSVKNISGQDVWGPECMTSSEQILTLKRNVARNLEAQVGEVLLMLGDTELHSENTLAEAAIPDGAIIQVVRLDLAEVAQRELNNLLSAGEGVELAPLTEDAKKVSDDESGAWLSGIAQSCGCGEGGLQRDVEGMLQAIRKCGKMFNVRLSVEVVISASRLKHLNHGPGLLCLESMNTEWGFRTTLVDLTGEMAGIFGASAEQYFGAVWSYGCHHDDWSDILYKFGLGEGPSIPKWRTILEHIRDINRVDLMPHPVAPNIIAFFSQWAAGGRCPSLVDRNEHAFRIPEVDQLKESTERLHAERIREEKLAKQNRLLRGIYSYLDKANHGRLTFSDLHPLWEVGGWLTDGSDATAIDDAFASLCKGKGFEAGDYISEPAFVACFLNMPFSPDMKEYYPTEDGMITHVALKDFLITLRAGPHCGERYLGPSQRQKIATRAVMHELFLLLDGDGDGYLSASEFRPFVELMHFYHPGDLIPPPSSTPWDSHHASFSEKESAERWQMQFKQVCEARAVPVATGFSEASFTEYLEKANIYYTELAWAADRVRTGPPPGGHHMSWIEFVGTTSMIHCSGCESASDVADTYGYASPLFKDLYEFALQGSPRLLTLMVEGLKYSVTVVPARQGLPDDWNLVEREPKVYEWTLEPND